MKYIFLDTERYGKKQDILQVGAIILDTTSNGDKVDTFELTNGEGIASILNNKTIRQNHKIILEQYKTQAKQDFKKSLNKFFNDNYNALYVVWGRNDKALLKKYVSRDFALIDYSSYHDNKKLEIAYNEMFKCNFIQQHTALSDSQLLYHIFLKDNQ